MIGPVRGAGEEGTAPPASVLFVCSQNVLRSPVAAELMRRRFGRLVYVESAGVAAGAEVDAFAVAAMEELGCDISRHRPKTIDALEDMSFDLIVTLTPQAHHRALELTRTLAVEVEYWPTQDPSLAQGSREQRLEEYRALRDALDARLARRFARPSTG
ncbi:MAG: low molecular weight phosphatase family protein [Hyphomonadaceae bacterium]|nr:low molecular weight phosphatase family protein [Hyphomonadaceae bacterium]